MRTLLGLWNALYVDILLKKGQKSAGTAAFCCGSHVKIAEKKHSLGINAAIAVLLLLLSAPIRNAGPNSPLQARIVSNAVNRWGDNIGFKTSQLQPFTRNYEDNSSESGFQFTFYCDICEADWNEQDNLCVECAPRENVELTAIRAERMVDEMREKAENANVFKGNIERRQTLCPECGKPSGEGKFCNNCGASISLTKCPNCGNKVSIGTRFCGECGTKLN